MHVLQPASALKSPDVEGQQIHASVFSTTCPHCGTVLAEEISTLQYQWFTCAVCGGAFQA
jgi:hypothetical protein